MNSYFLSLNTKDFAKGLVTAVLAAVITVLYQVTQVNGFDLFSADWGSILAQVVNTSTTVFVAYIAKNFLSDEDGKVLGSIG